MNIHFIAIGGAVMHSLAIALHLNGNNITGSDDHITEPSKSRLAHYSLLPLQEGWFKSKIHNKLDAVILGMHARADNPELLEAINIGVKVFSFPEYIYEIAKNKSRIVVAGSHGKTTITAMIAHVLMKLDKQFDWLVGATLPILPNPVAISKAPLMVIEGDEYLSSALDNKPKFFHYKPQTLIISGIAWDHYNVFPTYERYVNQFKMLLNSLPKGAKVIYDSNDKDLSKIVQQAPEQLNKIPYKGFQYIDSTSDTIVIEDDNRVKVSFFGAHNMANAQAAFLAITDLGIPLNVFLQQIADFKGAARRLESIYKTENFEVFRDFAHAPSKVKATLEAVKTKYSKQKVIAVLELHTFSSLSSAFLPQYNGTLESADQAVVFYTPATLAQKKLPPLALEEVAEAFGNNNIKVIDNKTSLEAFLTAINRDNTVLLLMSSGTFDQLDLSKFVTFAP